MRRTIAAITLAALAALTAPALLADEVYLKAGGQLTGEIVGHTEDSVTVDIGAGNMTVRLSSVVRIEKGTSPLQEYRARAATVAPGDIEAWRQLGRWAADEGLSKQSREAWSKVVATLPDDPEANRALGKVQHEGRWVTEEESYRAGGFVEFEGEWMTPAEQQSIQADRRAREETDRKETDARIAADEAASREREAREAAEWEEFGADLPQLGDSVNWGWGGVGPTYWPAAPMAQPRPSRRTTLPSRGTR